MYFKHAARFTNHHRRHVLFVRCAHRSSNQGVFHFGALCRPMTKLRISVLSNLIIMHNGSTENRANCTWIMWSSKCAHLSYFVYRSSSAFHIAFNSSPLCLLSFYIYGYLFPGKNMDVRGIGHLFISCFHYSLLRQPLGNSRTENDHPASHCANRAAKNAFA